MTTMRHTCSSADTNTTHYIWGLEISGQSGGRASSQAEMQGAGGVGGLCAVFPDNGITPHYPCYDANGNITEYVDFIGNTVAHYEYDAFGNTVSQTGSMADDFKHRFSTKYWDAETELYGYGERYYNPVLGRFISRDPIEEQGGLNLYGFCGNDPINKVDYLGMIFGGCSSQQYLPVMVAIFLSPIESGAETNTDVIIPLLEKIDKQLKWEMNVESLPNGKNRGKQPDRNYKGVCYKDVYFVEASLYSEPTRGGMRNVLGYGSGFSAALYAYWAKYELILLLGGDQDKSDEIYKKMGGFMLTHEILHSVGASHFGGATSVMQATPSLDWVKNPPSIAEKTVKEVKKTLGVKP